MKLNFSDLVGLISRKSTLSKTDVGKVLKELTTTVIEETQKGNSIGITKFGVFKPKVLKQRMAHIPSTGERKLVPERRTFLLKVI